ncbi:MAG TPA: SCO family protein, partial [Chryseosolibacter sp.]
LAGCGQEGKDDAQDLVSNSPARVTSAEEIDGMSIYQLTSSWKTQTGDEIELKDLNGEVLVVVMIYTSCQSACPRLVADMKGIESKISSSAPKGVRYVLVSIDPAHDTPERLRQFGIENEMTDSKWLFLQGTEESVREFANVLAVRYTQISPIDFSHSNIISVFDQHGVMRHQQEGLQVDYQETVKTALALTGAGPNNN